MIEAVIPSESNRSVRSWPVVPLILGLLIGAVVSIDPLLSWATAQPIGFASVARLAPYLYSIGILLGALALTLALAWRGPVFTGDRHVLFGGIAVGGMYFSGIGFGQASITAAAAVLLLAVWALERLLNPASAWSPTVFAGLMTLFLACGLLSTLGAPIGTFLGLAALVGKALVAVLLADLLRSMRQVRSTVRVFVWLSVLSAFLALLQVAASSLYGFNYTLVEDKNNSLVTVPWGEIVQASAFTRENNGLACMLATASLLTLARLFNMKDWKRYGAMGAVLLMWSMCLVSTVRGSWVAVTVGVLVLPYMLWPRRWPQWTAVIVLVTTVALASGAVTAALKGMEALRPSSVSTRVELLQAGMIASIDHPWNGTGLGQAVRYSPHSRWGAHTTEVQFSADLGLLASILFVAMLAWVGVRLAWAASCAATPAARTECMALLAGYIPFVTVMQSEPLAYGQFLWVYLGLCEAGAQAAIAART